MECWKEEEKPPRHPAEPGSSTKYVKRVANEKNCLLFLSSTPVLLYSSTPIFNSNIERLNNARITPLIYISCRISEMFNPCLFQCCIQ